MLYLELISRPLAFFPMKAENNAKSPDFTTNLAFFPIFLLKFPSSRFSPSTEKFQLYFLGKKNATSIGIKKKKKKKMQKNGQ